MSVDTKRARELAASLNREGLDYDEEEAMLVRLADEVDRLREENTRWLTAARRAIEPYPDGHENEGAYIVAFDEYERLDDLDELIAVAACEEKP